MAVSCHADLLVVDDDFDVADLLADALRLVDHEVRVAHNGREGLDRVSDRRPDAALVDVEMPVLDGPDMAYQLFVRNCGDEKIPIILVSGVFGLRDVAAALGTPYFLAKPYQLDALLQIVDRALIERVAPRPRQRPLREVEP